MMNESVLGQIQPLKEEAIHANVPILSDQGWAVLEQLIRANPIESILEIGCAVGYSSILMANLKGCKIDTIERDGLMIEQAKRNFALFPSLPIRLLEGDALSIDLASLRTYDLIFIDGAKAQYQAFFERFEPLLNEGGWVVCDNLHFHGYVNGHKTPQSRDLKQLVRKIQRFIDWVRVHPRYQCTFLDTGDGMCICQKKSERTCK